MSGFLLSCGGTGGHLAPGISLAEGLVARGHAVTLLISEKQVDTRLAAKYPQFEFLRVPGAPLGWSPAALARCAVAQARGVFFCLRLLRARRPDAIVAFGGFASAGLVLAGALRGVPVALHEANRVPGRAVRWLGRFARRVYLPPGVRLAGVRAAAIRHAGLPVRGEIRRVPAAEARTALGLAPHQRVVVVFGGSQGAAPLNAWARADYAALAAEGVQTYCVTGLGKGREGVIALRTRAGEPTRAVFVPFCDDVATLLSAADVVVARAGAGTLAELVRCETPAILVPFPLAADDHQRANAAFFERQGGGIALPPDDIDRLGAEVRDVIFNDDLLRSFRANLARMDRANSLPLMLRDLEQLAGPVAPAAAARPATA